MTQVGDEVTLTFTGTPGQAVNAAVTANGLTSAPVSVTETPVGSWPYKLVPDAPGDWSVTFRSATAAETYHVRVDDVPGVPPLASVEDLQARTGKTYTGTELARARSALDDASSMAEAEGGRQTTGAARRSVVVIVCKAARRELENPDGHTSETYGSHAWRAPEGSATGVYLTEDERAQIRRLAGRGGLQTMQVYRGDLDRRGDTAVYVPTSGGSPVPMLAAGDIGA